MMGQIDDRIVRVSIQIENQLKIYEGLDVHASGTKYANATQNDCEVKIRNLDRATRDYILTETSPFNLKRKPKTIIIEAGRESYGAQRIFMGHITESRIGQPADIALTMKAATGNFNKGKIVSRSQPGRSSLRRISGVAAQDNGLTLDYQAADKTIANYSHSGSALGQIDKIGQTGGVDCFADDETLYVKDFKKPLNGRVCALDLHSGMIGIPEITEHGLKVQFLLDNRAVVGGLLQVTSKLNPAATGEYVIFKLGFEIASRDTPFYYVAECKRLQT